MVVNVVVIKFVSDKISFIIWKFYLALKEKNEHKAAATAFGIELYNAIEKCKKYMFSSSVKLENRGRKTLAKNKRRKTVEYPTEISIGVRVVLHIVKSLTRLPSLCTLSLVGIVVRWTGSHLRLVDSVVRGGFVGHSIVPG